jgi:hypothetical protein
MFLATVAMMLITVAGQYVDPLRQQIVTPWHQQCKELAATNHDRLVRNPDGTRAQLSIRVYEHGWPSPYLARLTAQVYGGPGREWSKPKIEYASPFRAWGGSRNLSVSWSNYDNWPFWADDWLIRPGVLVLDGLIAIAIVAAIGASSEWWVRRRLGLLRFRLSDLLAALTVGCVLLGWYVHHRRLQQLEQREATSIIAPAFTTHGGEMTFGNHYQGPDWLRRLSGSEYLLPFLHHIYYASPRPGERWQDCFATLPQLPYLEEVHVRGPMPLPAWDYLKRCERLERLNLNLQPGSKIIAGDPALFAVNDLVKLNELKLRELTITCDAMLAEDVEAVARMAGLKRLTLRNVSATLAELSVIRAKYPELELRTTWYYDQWDWPTPPKDHDAAIARTRLSRQAFCCALSEPSSQ